MKFNIYDVCSNNNTTKAVLDSSSSNTIKNSLKKLNLKKKEIAKDIGITYGTLWRWLNRREAIPLKFFKILYNKYNIDLSHNILYMEGYSNKKKIKIPKKLNEDLAKIIGAHIADGHLRKRDSNWHGKKVTHYELVLREGYFSNAISFTNWFNNCFEYNLKPINRKNHYEVYISNKIIFNYFTKILNIPVGPKAATIEVPEYIKNSKNKIKIAFLKGIFMFDGSVERKTGYVSLVSRSKKLVDGVYSLLREISLEPDYINKVSDKYRRHRLIIRRKHKLNKCLILFEKETEKWCRLKNFLENKSQSLKSNYKSEIEYGK